MSDMRKSYGTSRKLGISADIEVPIVRTGKPTVTTVPIRNSMRTDEVAKVLCEYGEAIRGDWGRIDGRSERSTIQTFADAINKPQIYTAETLRLMADICPLGSGHWTEYCDDECEPTP
jgi:hypothetical protein